MTATDSVQNNVSFRLNGTLSTSASSVAISDDTTNGGACAFTDAQITVQSPDGNTFERMTASASAGTLTISARGIKLDQVLATDAALKREFRKGSIGYVTYMANQIANAAGAQSVTGTWTFTNGVASGQFASDAAADAAWSGGVAPDGAMFYNTGLGRNRIKESGNWVSSTGSVDYATTRICAPAAANNGEWYRDNTNSNALTFKNTSGTSFAFVVDATGKIASTAYDFATQVEVAAGTDTGKPLNSFGAAAAKFGAYGSAMYFGDGTDGDVTITAGTTTLVRDMYYRNLTINSGGILNAAGYKIFVSGTCLISAGGKIDRTGNNGGTGGTGGPSTGGTAGTAGTALAAGTLGADLGGAAGGTGGSTGAGANGTNGTAVATSYLNMTSAAGGNGGTGTQGAAGTAGTAASATRGALYNVVRSVGSILSWLAFPAATISATPPTGLFPSTGQYGGPASGGGGGGGGAGSVNNGGGGGGGSGGQGGKIFLAANALNNLGSIVSKGGNGGNGGAGYNSIGASGGGGAGGNGGAVILIYNVLTVLGTVDVTGGTGGTSPVAGPQGSSGGAGVSGAVIQIQIA